MDRHNSNANSSGVLLIMAKLDHIISPPLCFNPFTAFPTMCAVPKTILDALHRSYNRRDPARIEERHEHIQRVCDFLAKPACRTQSEFEDTMNTLCAENTMVTLLRVLEDDYYFSEYRRVERAQVCDTYSTIPHCHPHPCRILPWLS